MTTPVREWDDAMLKGRVPGGTRVYLKEELFQRTGSFKPRGALTVMLDLTPDALARGVTAVSAGNHAIAVAYAARALGSTAKVVMPRTANPFRVERCRALRRSRVENDLVPLLDQSLGCCSAQAVCATGDEDPRHAAITG